MNRPQLRFFIYFALLSWGATGCSTMQPVNSSLAKKELIDQIEVGDHVELITKAGEHQSIYVSSVSEKYLESDKEKFIFEEIEIVAIRKVNTAEKGAFLVASIAVAALMHALFWSLFLNLAL